MKEFFLAQIFNIWDKTGSGGVTCNIKGPCNFCDAIIVISNIITFLFQISIPIAVAVVVYGAITIMVSGGSEERFATGRKTITSAVTGLFIALAAWVIVNTILHLLGGNLDFPWNEISCSDSS